MTNPRRTLAWISVIGLTAFVLGCNWTAKTTSSGPQQGTAGPDASQTAFDTESGPHAAGKKVFVSNNCFRCHTIDGVRGPASGGMPMGGPGGPGPGGKGGPMGGGARAPDLGKVAGDPERNVDWFMKYVRNPKSVKPEARMPSFEGKINDKDLRVLAEYLASLK